MKHLLAVCSSVFMILPYHIQNVKAQKSRKLCMNVNFSSQVCQTHCCSELFKKNSSKMKSSKALWGCLLFVQLLCCVLQWKYKSVSLFLFLSVCSPAPADWNSSYVQIWSWEIIEKFPWSFWAAPGKQTLHVPHFILSHNPTLNFNNAEHGYFHPGASPDHFYWCMSSSINVIYAVHLNA